MASEPPTEPPTKPHPLREAGPQTPAPAQPQHRSEIDILTLTIAAIASAAAAFLSSRIWHNGTLVSAALTPVIVALVKEGLSRPADAVVRTGKDKGKVRHHWKLAAITGLAGFAIFASVATISELIAGRAAGDRNRATTLFGGTRTVVERHTVTTVTVVPSVTTVVPTTETRTETTTVTTPSRTQPTTTATTPTQSTTTATPQTDAPPAGQ